MTCRGDNISQGQFQLYAQMSFTVALLLLGLTRLVKLSFSVNYATPYRSERTFVAVKGNRQGVVTWGQDPAPRLAASQLVGEEITSVYSTIAAFAVLLRTKKVVVWGRYNMGGQSLGLDLTGIVEVASSREAFAALKEDGSVIVWGHEALGGSGELCNNKGGNAWFKTSIPYSCIEGSSVLTSLASGIETIYGNMWSFAAITIDGKIITWGWKEWGGDSSKVATYLRGGGMSFHYLNAYQYGWAALSDDGRVVTWGDYIATKLYSKTWAPPLYMIDESFIGREVTQVGETFNTLFNDKYISTFLFKAQEGLFSSGVVQVFGGDYAFVFLCGDSSLVCVGELDKGGGCNDEIAVKDFVSANITYVASSGMAFLALKTDGNVMAWGDNTRGANTSHVDHLLYDVKSIYSFSTGFAAMCEAGRVVVWSGCADSGPGGGSVSLCKEMNPGQVVTSGAISISTCVYAVAILLDTGEVVTAGNGQWGANISPLSTKSQTGPGSGIVEIFGSTYYRSISIYSKVYHLADQVLPFPTGQPTSQPSIPTGVPTSQPSVPTGVPTGEPTSQPSAAPSGPSPLPTSRPSRVPTSQPTGHPTGRPSVQPTTQPTSRPTSQPTDVPTSSPSTSPTHSTLYQETIELSSKFEIGANGVYFQSEYTFVQLGNQWGNIDTGQEREIDVGPVVKQEVLEKVYSKRTEVFLSLDVYKTGFGPDTTQFIQLRDEDRNVIGEKCAPNCCAGDEKCGLSPWHNCFANVNVTNLIKYHNGGALPIHVRSHGVLASSCPYVHGEKKEEEVIFVRVSLSYSSMPTNAPTWAPTPYSENPKFLESGDLEVNIGVGWATNIAALVTVLFGGYGVFCGHQRRRDKSSKAVRLNLLKCAMDSGFIGGEFTSMIFFVNRLYVADGGSWRSYAISFIVIKMVDMAYTLYFFSYIYGSKERQEQAAFVKQLDRKHMSTFSKSYAFVNILMCIDVSAVVFLPWRASPFSVATLGFPNISVYRHSSIITILTALATIILQAPFLSAQGGSNIDNLFFYISLALASIKFIVSSVSYATKASQAVNLDGSKGEEDDDKEVDKENLRFSLTKSNSDGAGMEMTDLYRDAATRVDKVTDNPLLAFRQIKPSSSSRLDAGNTTSLIQEIEKKYEQRFEKMNARLEALEAGDSRADERVAMLHAANDDDDNNNDYDKEVEEEGIEEKDNRS